MNTILSLYLLIGILIGFVVTNSDAHKKDTPLEKLSLFLTASVFWIFALIPTK